MAAYIAPPGILRASPQGGCFQVGSSSIYPSSVSKVCDVFSNKILPLISWRQPKATTTAYIILLWGSFGFPLTTT